MQLKLVSLLGLIVLIGVASGISADRRRFPWRAVSWGLALQFIFGWLILKTNAGATVFDFFQRGVSN